MSVELCLDGNAADCSRICSEQDYAAEVLSIYYSDTQTKPSSPCTSLPLNLAAYFPTPNVFFGFSSGTGVRCILRKKSFVQLLLYPGTAGMLTACTVNADNRGTR